MRRLQKKLNDKENGHRYLNILSLAASVVALAAAIWIVAPAPFYNVWLFSVAASEWSFALGALALFGIGGALVFGGGKIKIASILTGAAALLISLFPLASALAARRENAVSLSFGRYASGFLRQKSVGQPETFQFAAVDGQQLKLDVYSPPAGVRKNGAGVVVVHGGSWNAGERGDFPRWNEMLARNGYTVFDIDYRIAPQPNFLTATGDVKCAVLWIKRNAARFQISPGKIVLLGRSAGAHLALLAAYSAGDARLSPSCGGYENGENASLENASSNETENVSLNKNSSLNESVRGVVSFYAPVDLVWSYDNPANERVIDGKKTLRRFVGGSPYDSAEMREKYLLASPASHVKNGTPPTLLIHGGRDQLVGSENMNLLAERLNEANVPHKTVFLSYAQHGFDYNADGWGAQVAESILLDFLGEKTADE